ncbi:MAG: GAF domain-containing protein [Anaerolineales bacterium]
MGSDPGKEVRLSEQLQQLIRALDLTGRALLPASNRELLESIVDAAAHIFGASAASIALVDESQSALIFEVSTGPVDQDVLGRKVPLGKGLAGYVASTGQPLAISDVRQDPRFNQEFAESTGYVPSSILAAPLIWNDRVIGVMEVLDKIDSPSFGLQEMELLGIFANQAAIAISQSQQFESINRALLETIKRLLAEEPQMELGEVLRLLEWEHSEDERAHDLYAIAGHINSLSEAGESERRACLQILATFDDYLQSRPMHA